MPDEGRLPPGARRDLVLAVHELYGLAGKPSTRTISARIRDRNDLPGTLSHESVSAVLRGAGSLPRWANLESLVRVLVEDAITRLDVDAVIVKVHTLWLAADAVMSGVIIDTLPAPSFPPEGSIDPDGLERTSLAGVDDHKGIQIQEEASYLDSLHGSLSSPLKEPLVRWDHPRLGAINIFDRQMALQVIKNMGGPLDKA
jgi:hypothetical protein